MTTGLDEEVLNRESVSAGIAKHVAGILCGVRYHVLSRGAPSVIGAEDVNL